MADAVKEQVAHEVLVLQRTIKKLGEKNADGKFAVRLLTVASIPRAGATMMGLCQPSPPSPYAFLPP